MPRLRQPVDSPSDQADYDIVRKVGSGKYSEVFECVKHTADATSERCCMKILKPVKQAKVKRCVACAYR